MKLDVGEDLCLEREDFKRVAEERRVPSRKQRLKGSFGTFEIDDGLVAAACRVARLLEAGFAPVKITR